MTAAERVRHFLAERSRMGGLDQFEIASLNVGAGEREAVLTAEDLQALLEAVPEPTKFDRDEPPGLRMPPLDMAHCRQLVEHYAQSTAVHSRSQGWFPMVKLDLHHKPLVGPGAVDVLELVVRPEDLRRLLLVVRAAMDRAGEDAARGLID